MQAAPAHRGWGALKRQRAHARRSPNILVPNALLTQIPLTGSWLPEWVSFSLRVFFCGPAGPLWTWRQPPAAYRHPAKTKRRVKSPNSAVWRRATLCPKPSTIATSLGSDVFPTNCNAWTNRSEAQAPGVSAAAGLPPAVTWGQTAVACHRITLSAARWAVGCNRCLARQRVAGSPTALAVGLGSAAATLLALLALLLLPRCCCC